jgi:CMP-N,N'-diacetyllegionaminic acid synthase
MINNKKVLAVIPARGGSKRLARKNILPLGEKPLISWTIEAARECKYIDRVIVSTEDDEISDVSRKYNADVPFLRPEELAADDISTIDVVLHLLNELGKESDCYDYIVLLQPTSPLRTAKHIAAAFEQLAESRLNAIVSVCQAEHHPLWCNTLPEDGSMSSFLREDIHNIRSQDLPVYYRLNGAIYICDVGLLKDKQTFLPPKSCSAFIMPQEDSVDIDTKDDFIRAQLAFDSSIVGKSKFADQLFSNYMCQGFGRLSKAEVDMLMFDFFVKRYCLLHSSELLDDDEVDYFRIDKITAYSLSIELKLREVKVLEYIADLGLLKGFQEKKKGIQSWLRLLSAQKQLDKDLKDGLLKCHVSNKLMSGFVEYQAYSTGGAVDFSNNKEVMIIDMVNFFRICEMGLIDIRLWMDGQNKSISEEQSALLLELLTAKNINMNEVATQLSKVFAGMCVGNDAFKTLLKMVSIQWKKHA